MIVTEEVYLEHSGVKGMKWGVRKEQAASAARTAGRGSAVAGKAAWKGTKAVGRGAAATGRWVKAHPKQAAAIVVGGAFIAIHVRAKVRATKQGEAIAKGAKFISGLTKSSKVAPAAIPKTRSMPKFQTIKKSASLIKETPDVFRKVGRL